jgi:phosphatidylglycerol:prolipoprotein diacylglycerol transferase
MGINININPVLFTFGGLEVRWYGVMMALGVAVLILWAFNQVRRGAKLTYDNLLGAALVGIPSGIIFSRLLHVIDLWSYYSQNPGQIIGGEGLTIYGAILGAALGVWIYSRFNKLNFAYLADVITPGIILAQVLGRVGCLFNGCCYGKELIGSPFNIVYTNPDSFAPIGFPVQPTQFYEILFLLAVFAVIMIFRSKFKPDGVQFMFYLGMYSLWRIGIGFLRVGTPFAFGLEQAQVIGIVTAVICVSMIAYRVRKAKSASPVVEPPPATEIESESKND